MRQKIISFVLISIFLLEPFSHLLLSPTSVRAATASPGDVLITEINTDPQQDWSTTDFNGVVTQQGSISSSDEYVEIVNASNHVIDLTGWHLIMTDSGVDDAIITSDLVKNEQPTGDIAHVAPGIYLILGNPIGSMNNDVQVELYDGPKTTGHLINKVTLGNYDDGNSTDSGMSGDASVLTTGLNG